MNRIRLITLLASFALACGLAGPMRAADEATQKRADGKADRIINGLKLEDAAKAASAKAITADWYIAVWDWHKANDPKLNELWGQWNRARAVVPKDEFPAEVIAHQMDEVYGTLKPTYRAFVEKLSTVLTADQVSALKEAWSRSPGMMRTYNAYLETAPDLKEADKKVIFDRMQMAREDAMLSDADKEVIAIYKRHKVKVEAYIGTLEWAKLHTAFANKGKAPAPAAAAAK